MVSDYKIKVLEGLEGVRATVGMYIGSVDDGSGLHHLLREIIDNSVDEYLAGFCNKIIVSLHTDGSASVEDNGRGIPTYYIKDKKMTALEAVLTKLHAGGKFGGSNKENYVHSSGLNGVGASVCNALSNKFKAIVRHDGEECSMAFSKGKKIEDFSSKPYRGKSGTIIRFAPDPTIFTKIIKFDPEIIRTKLRELSFLCDGLTIIFIDEIHKTNEEFNKDDGLTQFVRFLSGNKKLIDEPIVFSSKKDDIIVSAALQWTEENLDFDVCKYYTNNIPNTDGGTHMVGFRSGLTRTINSYIINADLPKTLKMSLSGDDVREGLIGVVSIRHKDPKFNSQDKVKLVSDDARPAVESVVSEYLLSYLEQNPAIAKKIVSHCVNALKAREAAKRAREAVRKTSMDSGMGLLPGKLADCQEKNPDKCELFIVEGDSAGGCFSGDTKVALLDGRNIDFITLIKEYEEGKINYCYTIDYDNNIKVAPIINPRLTKKSVKVIKVILDNGEEIITTPDHKFMLKNGEYVEAKNSLDKSLMPLYRKISKIEKRITISGYEMFWNPSNNKWIFTHMIADDFNIKKGIYNKNKNEVRHHIDFNKKNNNPNNIIRMYKEEHLKIHTENLDKTIHSVETKEKCRLIRQEQWFRDKISAIMSGPEMSKMLSKRAKIQWEDEDYRNFMAEAWRNFYNENKEYREENNKKLNEQQRIYWSNDYNCEMRSQQVIKYFEDHPEEKENRRQQAVKQWANKELKKWRAQKTKEQWTDEFRESRKMVLKETYYIKTIEFMKKVFDECGSIDLFDSKRILLKNKSILSKKTFLERYFNNESDMLEAVKNYNHKVIEIIELNETIDVYDLEVPDTHNFALSSGIFVHNSAKQGRDRRFQAILPLRGKILNVEKCEFRKLLENEEIMNLITAIGAGVGRSFDPQDIRYGKIIIMTDADVDGAHIRALLLTFFFRQMPQLILNGNVYVARPPLYRIVWRGATYYIQDDAAKQAFMKEKGIVDGSEASKKFQRFKGLGEMNPSQLWETSMDPDTRLMSKISITDPLEADKIFAILMGDQVEPRKEFIVNSAQYANVDI